MKKYIINNVSDLIQILNQLGNPEQGKMRFFRGQADKSWKIQPSIFRSPNLIRNEDKIIKDTFTSCPDDFLPSDTLFEKLVKLQHYGCKTRLLDLTTNALVALYFACVETSHHNKDGELIILDIPNEYIKYSDSDTVSILSAISIRPNDFNIKDCTNNASITQRMKESEYVMNNYERLKNFKKFKDTLSSIGHEINMSQNDYEDLIFAASKEEGENAFLNSFNEQKEILALTHDIRADKPSFRPVINHKDFNKILCVKAKLNNARIVRQQGCFLLYGMNHNKLTPPSIPNEWIRKSGKQKFIIRNKENIIKELELFGVSTQTLFPELEKQATEIVSKYNI
ncbi:FRG domain-containing protein [Aggregatibacter kilianii]|uniref:FRG domain-containing protein n=1 Tax=Aggregatibacter kilianii TaxID=2025884 RepID=UPI000D6556F3|nr:FRG domain-containing protein [Aggregatibacter kilianii]